MTKLLFADTETGGLEPESSSLLSVGLVVWENGNIINEKEILLKENNLKLSDKAMGINKIDINAHITKAVEHNEAIRLIKDFCFENFVIPPLITLAGHNINFDIKFLKHLFKQSDNLYSKIFSHRSIDTASILKFLYFSNILETDISSSDAAFKHFSINIEKRHTALGDARATALLFNELLKLVSQPNKSYIT